VLHFYSFTLSLSPDIVSKVCFYWHLFLSLFLVTIPESQHICVWDVPPLSSIPSNNDKNLILFFYVVPESKHVEPVCAMCVKWHSFQATTVLQFALVYRPGVPACWSCLWVVPPLSSIPSNNHKYVCFILLFNLVPESKYGEPVCEVCIKCHHPWIPACWPCLWVMPPLTSTPSNNHKYVCSILLFYIALSPSMVSPSVRHAYHFKLQPYHSLLLHIPAYWRWLWVMPPLSSIPIKKHKIVHIILLFHLDHEFQNVEQVWSVP